MSIHSSLHTEATYTALLALTLLVMANVAAWVMSRNQTPEAQRFWKLTFRHLAALGFVFGLAVIWKSELQSFVLALGAATAGFLIAFREAWVSLLAFWIRVIKRPYGPNDFIEVDGVRGKVIDITWLTTVVAESIPGKDGAVFSGRVVHVPNNRMLLSTIVVDNLLGEYALHVINMPLPKGFRPLGAMNLLTEVAERHCRPFYQEARRHLRALAQEKALDIAAVRPTAFLSVGDDGAVTVRLQIIVPQFMRNDLQRSILAEFFEKADDSAWPELAKKGS